MPLFGAIYQKTLLIRYLCILLGSLSKKTDLRNFWPLDTNLRISRDFGADSGQNAQLQPYFLVVHLIQIPKPIPFSDSSEFVDVKNGVNCLIWDKFWLFYSKYREGHIPFSSFWSTLRGVKTTLQFLKFKNLSLYQEAQGL